MPSATAEPRVEKNVVYAMYSGLALLMDVHHPDRPNGHGLVLIPGSGWQATQVYGAGPIKDGGSSLFVYIPSLLNAGYTLFVVNHRAAPRFRYPAAVEDVQRAGRFVRSRAREYGISVDRLGAVGYSSGGHLASLLGVLDGIGAADDPDPVNRLSARVACVVAAAAPSDLAHFEGGDVPGPVAFIGMSPPNPQGTTQDPVAVATYRAASPVTHLSRSSAPLLLMHGDADEAVPFRQSELMFSTGQKVGAEVKLIRVPGGGHGFAREIAKHPEWPDVLGETVRWLDQHLKATSSR